ncbi:uncharacterized protein K452DRAFT_357411 [Aplosporella prunicola CBS 121167]|uniref:Uncharacterized protein n=1 Tax=Aplosporella prunicola CBS 121167 TaxID=1176127 RepID=A0A6A6BJJ4_9PEZI|nr:uncharacterized protein K452DRAFT_357411 [Aplosporella prunicola CBS 121167]KAF2143798.1 hypothetical protein K452DRAFT_357411 [Aplosporella prunicola CBS 121167]
MSHSMKEAMEPGSSLSGTDIDQDAPMDQSSKFLSIPRELRDNIYEQLIRVCWEETVLWFTPKYFDKPIYHPKTTWALSYGPPRVLLLVNRQTAEEYSDSVSRISRMAGNIKIKVRKGRWYAAEFADPVIPHFTPHQRPRIRIFEFHSTVVSRFGSSPGYRWSPLDTILTAEQVIMKRFPELRVLILSIVIKRSADLTTKPKDVDIERFLAYGPRRTWQLQRLEKRIQAEHIDRIVFTWDWRTRIDRPDKNTGKWVLKSDSHRDIKFWEIFEDILFNSPQDREASLGELIDVYSAIGRGYEKWVATGKSEKATDLIEILREEGI